jgi:hypothetical protein
MRVRFLRHYQTYRRGQSYDIGEGICRSLLQMGICEPAPQMLFEATVAPEPQERAVAPIAKKKARKRTSKKAKQ